MSSQVYCTCNRPNTRQTAFARANGFDCPDCNRRLNPDPNADTYQENNNTQETPSSPTPNFLPPSPLSQYGSLRIPPDNYPNALSELLNERIFDAPDPPEIRQLPEDDEEVNRHNSREQNQHTPPIPVRSTSAPPATRLENREELNL